MLKKTFIFLFVLVTFSIVWAHQREISICFPESILITQNPHEVFPPRWDIFVSPSEYGEEFLTQMALLDRIREFTNGEPCE